MSKKMLISCDEATTICDKNQYGEASFFEKIKLTLHLFLCKHCKTYSQQNNILSKIFGRYLTSCDDQNLKPQEKEELKQKLKEKMHS